MPKNASGSARRRRGTVRGHGGARASAVVVNTCVGDVTVPLIASQADVVLCDRVGAVMLERFDQHGHSGDPSVSRVRSWFSARGRVDPLRVAGAAEPRACRMWVGRVPGLANGRRPPRDCTRRQSSAGARAVGTRPSRRTQTARCSRRSRLRRDASAPARRHSAYTHGRRIWASLRCADRVGTRPAFSRSNSAWRRASSGSIARSVTVGSLAEQRVARPARVPVESSRPTRVRWRSPSLETAAHH